MNHIVPGTDRGIVHDHGLVVIHEADVSVPRYAMNVRAQTNPSITPFFSRSCVTELGFSR